MNSNRKKSLLALLLCFVLCLSFAACGDKADETDDSDVVSDIKKSSAGGSDITLPEGFVMPESANKMEAVLAGDAYEGVIYLSGYRSSNYVFINGASLTMEANLYLTDANGEGVKTDYQDVKVALWEKGTNEAVYKDTIHFTADGTNQSYTFDGLKAGGEYRISITYSDVPKYRVNGKFRLTSVSATGSTEETAAEE
ncbi:MAG: hypothetical protein RR825_01385 [Ruthenibacterium sp.]